MSAGGIVHDVPVPRRRPVRYRQGDIVNRSIPAAAAAATAAATVDADAQAALAHPLLRDARVRHFVTRRRRFAWLLTAVMLALYFAFIVTLAFAPARLGEPIVPGRPTTWGIPVGFGMFVATFALVALYVWRANSAHDALVASIRNGGRR
nr:DUF485 domain-containing protein [Burkholderia dolosa]